MKNKKILLLLATALVLGACGNEAAKPADDANKEETKVEEKVDETETKESKDGVKEVANDSETASKDPIPATEKTLEEAIDAFYTHYGDDTIELTSAELDEEDGKYCYGINGFKDGEEYDLVLDANTLEVVSESKETEDDTNVLVIDKESLITAKEAMEKALEGQAEGAWIKGYELDVENEKATFDVDVEGGNDVLIDATTGEIIK